MRSAILICKNNVRPKTYSETKLEEEARKVIIQFGKDKLGEYSIGPDDILSQFKFHGLSKAFKKLQTQEGLSYDEELAVINFADAFTSVSLCQKIVGKEVVEIAKKVNKHKHTRACRKYQTECRFSFPKYPVWKTLISYPNKPLSDIDKSKFSKILADVKEVLLDEGAINKIII